MPSILARITPHLERASVQCLFGGLFALAFAPYHVLLAFIVPLWVYYYGLRRASGIRAAMVRSFWFGYGFSVVGTYWIAFSLLVDADTFGWLIPFSVLGLSALMALWWVVQGALYFTLRQRNPVFDALIFASAIMLIEYAKSFGMFGFPWNLNGYALIEHLPLAQFASIAGVYGLGFIAVLALALIYHVRVAKLAAIAAVVGLVGVYGWGMHRLQTRVLDSDVMVRLVQPNITQNMKWSEAGAREAMASLATFSKHGGLAKPDIVIWPETALAYTITPDANWKAVSANMLPEGASLITGAVRADAQGHVYNSIMFVKNGALAASYDKHQLVPFGEFVPLRDVLPLDKITPGAQDFSKGQGPVTVAMGALSMSPLVCYEAVFSHIAVARDARPALLLNLTNDAWFGDSPGPYQHLDMARMRTIEYGLPLIRVANTGVSAIISPYGQILAALALNTGGTLDRAVPQANISSLYARYGMVLPLFPVVVLMVGGIATRRRKG